VLDKIVEDFPNREVRIFVEEEDPALNGSGCKASWLGPNPKIRNMSRGYREAVGDIVWIIDCNVWVGSGACGRMVDKLCGYGNVGQDKGYKFVHHLPVCIDVNILSEEEVRNSLTRPTPAPPIPRGNPGVLNSGGGRLEELFLSSSHAKMYTAINTVAVAPCIIGKSNMFRRSHVDHLTSLANRGNPSPDGPASSQPSIGIDHFSHNICEDHLIGDLLWRSPLPSQPNIGNHGLVFGDLAIQPIARMSVPVYIARRVRWLRVRKFTVTLATLVEPGTECFLCSAYGAFGLTALPWAHQNLGIPQTWSAFALLWLISVAAWAAVDWTVSILLYSGRTLAAEQSSELPPFAKPVQGLSRRPFTHWLAAWLGREALALPIWVWAFWGGATVEWRGRRFWVGRDMRVHEIEGQEAGKARRD
jgi:ceramide glucosyltransferase